MSDEITPGGGLEEFAPRTRVTKGGEEDSPISAGWSVDKRPATKRGDRPVRLQVPDDGEELLIKFLEERPFASFFQHWIKTEQGRRAYVCLGKGCPLCARGDTPKSQDWFNVIEMDSGEGNHQVKLWCCSADPAKAVKDRASKERTSPINRDGLYFAVSKRTGKNGFNTYTLDYVKEDELNDWGVVPLTKEKISEFEEKKYTRDLVKIPTKADLQEVAEEYLQD